MVPRGFCYWSPSARGASSLNEWAGFTDSFWGKKKRVFFFVPVSKRSFISCPLRFPQKPVVVHFFFFVFFVL